MNILPMGISIGGGGGATIEIVLDAIEGTIEEEVVEGTIEEETVEGTIEEC